MTNANNLFQPIQIRFQPSAVYL